MIKRQIKSAKYFVNPQYRKSCQQPLLLNFFPPVETSPLLLKLEFKKEHLVAGGLLSGFFCDIKKPLAELKTKE
jgi:hypothetical protein